MSTSLLNKNDKTRVTLNIVGDFHSDAVRIRERFTVIDTDTIRYEATFDDPTVYTRPFTMRLNLGRAVRGEAAKTHELIEEACREGERSTPDMLQKVLMIGRSAAAGLDHTICSVINYLILSNPAGDR